MVTVGWCLQGDGVDGWGFGEVGGVWPLPPKWGGAGGLVVLLNSVGGGSVFMGSGWLSRGHIRCCGNGHLGFRSYSGSLLANAPKVTKRSVPHHSVPRLGSACPHSGLNPWAAATGHPWPNAANPASCRVTHGFKPAFGQRG